MHFIIFDEFFFSFTLLNLSILSEFILEPVLLEHSTLTQSSAHWFVMRYLDSGLGQVDFEGHLLSHEDVWVAGFGKQSLEDVQLCACKGGALPTLFTRCVYKKEEKDNLYDYYNYYNYYCYYYYY